MTHRMLSTRSFLAIAAAVALLAAVAVWAQAQAIDALRDSAEETDENPFADPEVLPAGDGVGLQIDPKVYRWSAGQPPLKMIHQSEGICFLTGIEGQLAAGTDGVRVSLGSDGFWYLSGTATDRESSLTGTAMAVRFVKTASAEQAPNRPNNSDNVPPRGTAPQTRIQDKRLEVKLPAPTDRVVVGGGGKYLICHLQKLGQLAIFDVVQGKVVKYLSVGEGARFAAGRDKLVIVRSPQDIVQRYALDGNFERELSVASPVEGVIADIVMGAASDGPILARLGGDRFGRGREVELLDLETLKRLDVQYAGDSFGVEDALMWASADGSTFGFQRTRVSPSGLTTLTVRGKRATFRYDHTSVGYVMPSSDGSLVFTAGGLYNADLEPLDDARRSETSYLPALHPAYFLGVSDRPVDDDDRGPPPKTISIYSVSDRRKLLSLPPLPELQVDVDDRRGFRSALGLGYYTHLHVLPMQKRLVTIPAQRDRLYVRRFDLVDALQQADIDYLFVASLPSQTAERGESYRYPIRVESRRGDVKYELEGGPDGMAISSEGILTWKPPADFAEREVGVIIQIRDASEQEIFHAYTIRIPAS